MASGAQAILDAVAHGVPNGQQLLTNGRFAAPGFFIFKHQLANAQLMLLT